MTTRPPLPNDYLGVSPDAFRAHIDGLEPEYTNPVPWQGDPALEIPVYRIDVRRPRYNHMNGRIIPAILEHLRSLGLPEDHYESIDVSGVDYQREFHNFLQRNPQRLECENEFLGGRHPDWREALIATPDGRIINGNQRLSVYRDLYLEGNFENLSHIWVAVLPVGGTEDDYRALEATLQENVLRPTEFDWIQTMLSRSRDLRRRDEGVTEQERLEQMARRLRTGSVEDIMESITKLQIIDRYLEHIGQPDQYETFARESRHVQNIQEILNGRTTLEELANTNSDFLTEEFEHYSFELMQEPESARGGGYRGVAGHIIMLSQSLQERAANYELGDAAQADDILSELIEGDVSTEVDAAEPLDFINREMTTSELVTAIRDDDTVRRIRRERRLNQRYARQQTRSIIGVLTRIRDEWDEADFDLTDVPENLAQINSLVGEIEDLIDD